MQVTIAQYAQTGAQEIHYLGVCATRSTVLVLGYIEQLDDAGMVFKNPTTGDTVRLSVGSTCNPNPKRRSTDKQ